MKSVFLRNVAHIKTNTLEVSPLGSEDLEVVDKNHFRVSLKKLVEQRNTVDSLMSMFKLEELSIVLLPSDPVISRQEALERVFWAIFPSSGYFFDRYKSEKKHWRIEVVSEFSEMNHCLNTMSPLYQEFMDTVNGPANEINPTSLPAIIEKLYSKIDNVRIAEVISGEELQKRGMNLIWAVGKGSVNPPKLFVVEVNPEATNRPHIMVGKGICMDTGGYDIKSFKQMQDMNKDMTGAALSIFLPAFLAKIDRTKKSVFVFALAENLISGNSFKPNDIYQSYGKKTIEIISTDAEGRLLFADMIPYIEEKYPECESIITVATLTGAAQVALGKGGAAMFSHNQGLLSMMTNAAQRSMERVYQLPLIPDIKLFMARSNADMNNYAEGVGGGAVLAAMFIEEAFSKDSFKNRWIHLDIAPLETPSIYHTSLFAALSHYFFLSYGLIGWYVGELPSSGFSQLKNSTYE